MKKLLIIPFLMVSLISCKDKVEDLVDIYYLQGTDNDVILLDYEKFITKYPDKTLPNKIEIDGKLIQNGKELTSFNTLNKSGFQHIYTVKITKITNFDEIKLILSQNAGKIEKKLIDIVNITKEKYNFVLLNDVKVDKGEKEVKFKMSSLRIKEINDEYLPNSNNFILIVNNEKGRVIYNSALGKDYLQVISKIAPMNIGESFTRECVWNYLDNDGKKVGKGKYNVNLVIPSKPTPYIEKTIIIID